jgi:CO/xanthine dehydrogenase Mo-binding subunit
MTRRRTFLAAAAGALAVVAVPGGFRAVRAAGAAESAEPSRLDTWLRIGRDGTVHVYTGKVEIGMGVVTGLAQIVAEELDVRVDRIHMITGDTAFTPDQGGVGGSTSTELGARPLRSAAAHARAVLIAAAAQRLGAPRDRLEVRDGVVRRSDDPSRSVAYGELVAALTDAPPLTVSGEGFSLDLSGPATPKDRSSYRIVGKPVPRLDVPAKVYGRFTYAGDVRVPGMLHARVVRPPAAGARPITIDRSRLRTHGDARIVRIGDLLAVVATHEWDAVAGARDLRVAWTAPSTAFPAGSLADAMWAMPAASRDTLVERGDVAAVAAGATIVEARYFWPFQSHATMGPGCAVADVRNGTATIWCGTQKPYSLREGLADLLGLAPSRVRIVFVEDAGSYGRAGFDDTAADAALISRAAGKPVRVQWMRHDMTEWGPKAPAIVGRLRGALRDGSIAALDVTMRAFNGGEISSRPNSAGNFLAGQLTGRANDKPRVEYAAYGKNSAAYDIPALRGIAELVAPLAPAVSPLRTTHLRDPEGPGTTFIVESFVDELAARAGADPIAFRLVHLRDPRALEVLRRAADTAAWHDGPAARAARRSGIARGRGVAFAKRGETMVATIADVTVDTSNGRVAVTRLVCAHDCGSIVNPRSLRGTIEANLIQSMSRALFEEVRFAGGSVTSRDWETYPVARSTDVPERIDVVMIDRPDLPPYGAGEPSSRPTAAAIANAIYDATGARVRTAPLMPVNVRAALAG